jgi:hypothetical protein
LLLRGRPALLPPAARVRAAGRNQRRS